MKIKELEIYPNVMLLRIIEAGLIKPEEENSAFIIISSYLERMNELCELIPQNKRLLLNFSSVERIGGQNSFSMDMARDINELLNCNEDVDRLYLCCDDGQTRSAGIACALYRIYNMRDMEKIIWNSPHMNPNLIVYSNVLKVLGTDISAKELEELRVVRDTALIEAIYKQTQISREIFRYGLNSRVDIEKRLDYYARLYSMEGNSDLSWLKRDNICELSVSHADYETMELCREIALNSAEFIWFYGIKPEDFGH